MTFRSRFIVVSHQALQLKEGQKATRRYTNWVRAFRVAQQQRQAAAAYLTSAQHLLHGLQIM